MGGAHPGRPAGWKLGHRHTRATVRYHEDPPEQEVAGPSCHSGKGRVSDPPQKGKDLGDGVQEGGRNGYTGGRCPRRCVEITRGVTYDARQKYALKSGKSILYICLTK